MLSGVRSVAVGSKNPTKVGAARAVIEPLLASVGGASISSFDVKSGVPDQPFGDDETIRGARARAVAAREACDADLGVGIEGGCVETGDGGMRTCAWAAVVDRSGRVGIGGSLAMMLPESVAARVRGGAELGTAIDELVALSNTKHSAGAVGYLTAGLVDRQRAYEPLVAYALAPFLTPQFYGPGALPPPAVLSASPSGGSSGAAGTEAVAGAAAH